MINQQKRLNNLCTQRLGDELQGAPSRAAAACPLPYVYNTSHGAMCLGALNELSKQDSWMNGACEIAGVTHEQDVHESNLRYLFDSNFLRRACRMQAQNLMQFVRSIAVTLQTGFDFVLLFFSKRGQYDQVIYYTHVVVWLVDR